MKNIIYASIYLLLFGVLSSCTGDKTNPVTQAQPLSQTLIYQKPGLVDSIIGTCSTFLVRTFYLDTLDFSQFTAGKFEKSAFTDGDLSEIKIYYLNAGTAVTLFSLQGLNQINSAEATEFPSPGIKTTYFMQVKLYSSICTGNYFYIRLSDVKIFGLK
jgi:hypothetical protein